MYILNIVLIFNTPIDSTLRGTKIISASRTIGIHLLTCFQYKKENSRAFELKMKTITLLYNDFIVTI
jgi:hypothetical protein